MDIMRPFVGVHSVEVLGMAHHMVFRHDPIAPMHVARCPRDVEELRSVGYVLPQTLYGFLDGLEAEGRTLIYDLK